MRMLCIFGTFTQSFLIHWKSMETLIDTDEESGRMAKKHRRPNYTFYQLLAANKSHMDEITIFTDGSRSSTEDSGAHDVWVGAAFWVPQRTYKEIYKLRPEASSFTAETVAISKALDYTRRNRIMYTNICSDSLSCLQAITSSEYGKYKLCPMVRDIKRKVYFLKKDAANISVRFTWCPAHCGITDNEEVDKLAKLASREGLDTPNKVDFRQISSFLADEYERLDAGFLGSLNTEAGKFYLQDDSRVNARTIRSMVASREDACTLLRIVAGYAYTNHYKYRIGLIESPGCSCGFEDQDMEHIMWACPGLEEQRMALYRSLISEKLFPPFSLKYIIANLDYKITKAVIRFIRSSDIRL